MTKQKKQVTLARKIAGWCLPILSKTDYDKETKRILKDKSFQSFVESDNISRDKLYDAVYKSLQEEYGKKANRILLHSARALDMDKLSSIVTGIIETFVPGVGLTAGIEDIIELGIKTAYLIPYWIIKRDTANAIKLFTAEEASCYPAFGEGIDIFNLYVNQLHFVATKEKPSV